MSTIRTAQSEAHGLPLSSYECCFTYGGLRSTECGWANSPKVVRREPCPEDRRGAYAILTEAGPNHLGEAHPTHLAGMHEFFLEHLAEERAEEDGGVFWRFGYRGTGITAVTLVPDRRNKMNLRLIPTRVHGVLDYLASGVKLAFPGLLGLHDAPWATLVPASTVWRGQATV